MRMRDVARLGWVILIVGLSGLSTAWAKPGEIGKFAFLNGDVKLWLSGEYRARMELMQGRDFKAPDKAAGTPEDRLFVVHRARLEVGALLWSRVEIMMQFQDVRLWGQEADTLADFQAKGFDLHQGWARFLFTDELSLKVGRMELGYDNERILGAVDWTQQARSFNGVLLAWDPSFMQLHAFYAAISQKDTLLSASQMTGAWAKVRKWKFFQPSLLYVFDFNTETERYRHTIGTHITGAIAGFSYTGEFYYQTGTQKTLTETQQIQSYLGALSLGYQIPVPTKPTIRVWADFVSGDDNPTDSVYRSFDTLFATNHKFYGFADIFLNLPVHTKQRGLMDLGASVGFSPFQGFGLTVWYHYFRLFHGAPDANQQMQQELASEIDVVASYTFLNGHAYISTGYSIVLPTAGMAVLGKGNQPEHWFFVECRTKF